MALVIWKALWHTAKHQGSNTTPGLDTRVQGAGCVHASGSGDLALFPATQLEQAYLQSKSYFSSVFIARQS